MCRQTNSVHTIATAAEDTDELLDMRLIILCQAILFVVEHLLGILQRGPLIMKNYGWRKDYGR